jgi:hypothetical protein
VTSFQSLPRDVPGLWRTRLEIVCHSYHVPLRKAWLAELSTLVLNIQFLISSKDLFSLSTFYATCDAASEVSRWKLLLNLQTTIFRPPLFICSSVHLFICSSVHLFICSSVHLFICSSVHLLALHLLRMPRTDLRLPKSFFVLGLTVFSIIILITRALTLENLSYLCKLLE